MNDENPAPMVLGCIVMIINIVVAVVLAYVAFHFIVKFW